jgi:secreted trypsin-like serine protease
VSENLLVAEMKVIKNEDCVGIFSDEIVVASTICAQRLVTSSCNSDMGSALVYKDSTDKWVQIGVRSFEHLDMCTTQPSGFVRTTAILGWMAQEIGQGFNIKFIQRDLTSNLSIHCRCVRANSQHISPNWSLN